MHRIKDGDIQVGEPLQFDCYDANGVLLLKQGIAINSERQLLALIERGLFASANVASQRPAAAPADYRKKSPFLILDEFKNRLRNIFSNLSNSEQNDFSGRIVKLCQDIQALCQFDADAALGALHLDHEGRYPIIHPLHVAILSEMILQRKELPAEERVPVLAAALTANISIIDLQEALQKQSTPLTPEQREAIRLHPLAAVDALLQSGVQNDTWIKTVLHHHEKLDGSGYPGALRGDDIPVPVRVVSLADMYSAMITPRVYRKQILAKEALCDIFLKRGGEIDAALAQLFIKELGIYPPGAFVKLQNGDTAVVTRRGANSTSPVMKSIIGPRGAILDRPIQRDSSDKNHEIRETVCPDRTLRLDLHLLWDY